MVGLELEVWGTIEAMNRCWTGGDPAGLRDYFHETAVAITPADSPPLVGRDACVAAWRHYARTTRILSWETHDARVQVYGDCAVATYRYEMVCERDGKRFHPAGRDMMFLVREEGRWWVVADQFSPDPAKRDV
jgi:ketosteroid isomerase-like protein